MSESIISNQPVMTDFPKIQCPFIRQTFPVDKDNWKQFGSKLQLRQPEVYLVVDKVNPDYEWVFDDKDTIAVEKLNGTNIKILTENGRLIAVQNRKNVIDPLQIFSGKTFIMEGIFRAIDKDRVKKDGEQVGELIGPKLQGNPYKLDIHEWYPFENAISGLQYKSFNKYERNFDNLSSWFKEGLISRFFEKRAQKLGLNEKVMAEGVVFYNLKRKAEHNVWMAKLRRDMFDWYYSDSIQIIGYDKKGRDEIENQERFD